MFGFPRRVLSRPDLSFFSPSSLPVVCFATSTDYLFYVCDSMREDQCSRRLTSFNQTLREETVTKNKPPPLISTDRRGRRMRFTRKDTRNVLRPLGRCPVTSVRPTDKRQGVRLVGIPNTAIRSKTRLLLQIAALTARVVLFFQEPCADSSLHTPYGRHVMYGYYENFQQLQEHPECWHLCQADAGWCRHKLVRGFRRCRRRGQKPPCRTGAEQDLHANLGSLLKRHEKTTQEKRTKQ